MKRPDIAALRNELNEINTEIPSQDTRVLVIIAHTLIGLLEEIKEFHEAFNRRRI